MHVKTFQLFAAMERVQPAQLEVMQPAQPKLVNQPNRSKLSRRSNPLAPETTRDHEFDVASRSIPRPVRGSSST